MRNMQELLISALLLCLLLFVHVVEAEAHPHLGKNTPFKSGKPDVKLNTQAIQILKQGQPYKTQIQSGSSGRGLVVQDVHAPTDVVWDRILDFDNYSSMVPKTVESKIYRREVLNKRTGLERIWVRMKVGFPIIKLQFYVNHLYDPAQDSMTWTLDYTKKSDIDDSVGYWYVEPHPDRPTEWTRLYYSVDVAMFSWVPKFVVDFMSKQALTDATAWVKKYSEIEYAKQEPLTAATTDDVQYDDVQPSQAVIKRSTPAKLVYYTFLAATLLLLGKDVDIVIPLDKVPDIHLPNLKMPNVDFHKFSRRVKFPRLHFSRLSNKIKRHIPKFG